MVYRSFSLANRLLRFRKELVLLWRAFLTPVTPMHLKVLMLLIPLYLVSPIDLVPDFIPFAGWLDDAIVIPMLVSWIFGMLPRPAPVRPTRNDERAATREPGATIDGTWRRL